MTGKDPNIALVQSDKPLKEQKKPRKPRVGRLNSASQVRKEMASVYKKARHGDISLNELKGYISALVAMVGPIRESELEERIKKLEGK